MFPYPTRFHRFFRFFALALLWGLAGCVTDSASPYGKSVLWRVRSSTNTVYLMGSVHVLPKQAYPLKPALLNAFNDSQRLVFEIPPGDMSNENTVRAAYQSGYYPPGESLSKKLSPSTLALLQSILPTFGVPLEKIESLRPWLVSDLITNSYMEKLGYYGDLGLDIYFYHAAEKTGKPTSGLEKMRDQTNLFAKFTDAEADDYLRDTLLSLPTTAGWIKATVKAWSAGDVQKIDDVVNKTRGGGDENFYHSVFEARNDAWLPQIEHLIGAKQNYLIIVGSGHLVGHSGVIEQLRRVGYSVEQL